jgi:hypothetical protein
LPNSDAVGWISLFAEAAAANDARCLPSDQSFGFDSDPVDEIVAATSIAHG